GPGRGGVGDGAGGPRPPRAPPAPRLPRKKGFFGAAREGRRPFGADGARVRRAARLDRGDARPAGHELTTVRGRAATPAPGTAQPAAAAAAAPPAESSCILIARYQPSATSQGSSSSFAPAGVTLTMLERRSSPPTRVNCTTGSSRSFANWNLVIQKFELARNCRPSAICSVPPALQVLFMNTARSASCPWARTLTWERQKPTRLNVQLPSSQRTVASDPNMLRK